MNRPGAINEHLAHMELFRGLSKRQLHTASNLGTMIDGDPGLVLTREGSPGGEFIVLIDGTVEV